MRGGVMSARNVAHESEGSTRDDMVSRCEDVGDSRREGVLVPGAQVIAVTQTAR